MRPPVPPGDDFGPVPPPVDDDDAPLDRFCDLVLTGGVASGVVYPWAIVELARAFRFRNIGGTSVGAMAAALAAAAEYGRRTGAESPFEVLRRLPASLGEDVGGGRTRMLSLFQPTEHGRRLIELWGRLFDGSPAATRAPTHPRCARICAVSLAPLWAWAFRKLAGPDKRRHDESATGAAKPAAMPICNVVCELSSIYASAWRSGALRGGVVGALAGLLPVAALVGSALPIRAANVGPVFGVALLEVAAAALLGAVLGAPAGLAVGLWRDFQRGVIRNNLGLCAGGTVERQDRDNPSPALCEWLHQGIQRSAGLAVTDRPLTFRDLWNAPFCPGAAHGSCRETDPPTQRAINLQMITSNITHGRPYHMPFADETSRLFFLPSELAPYLPPSVLQALVMVAKPYAKQASADPPPSDATREFLQLPGADMPILLAARLSLSFPLLFSAVPLYAIDYENPVATKRSLKRCLFSDGGISSNFPIHLFDAAIPRWPTFGLWLDRPNPYDSELGATGAARKRTQAQEVARDVWLPEFHRQGWGDSWDRFDPRAAADVAGGASQAPARDLPLAGYLLALLATAKDWRDRTAFRLPHVRNRVARLRLRRGEGGLHIGMPRQLILDMAARYGTVAGKQFVERFADRAGEVPLAWREQRWVRLQLLVGGLRGLLVGISTAAAYQLHATPVGEAIAQASRGHDPVPPLREHGAAPLTPAQGESLDELLAELQHLERRLRAAVPQDYRPLPLSEMRLRSRL